MHRTYDDSCSLNGPSGTLYGWWDAGDQLDFPFPGPFSQKSTPTVTAIIVTVVHTVANITSLQTIMPSDWIPPPTNAEGTKIQVVTYLSDGGTYSTTM